LFQDGNPFFNNVTQFSIDLCLLISMTAWTNNARTLPDKALVFIGLFGNLDVQGTVFHSLPSQAL